MRTCFICFGLTIFCSIISIAVTDTTNANGFALGTQYIYKYATHTEVNAKKIGQERQCSAQNNFEPAGRELALGVRANVLVAPIWQDPVNPQTKLIQCQISNPMANITKASSTFDLSNTLSSTFYIQISYGKIQGFYTSRDTPVNSMNFQRGVASLFQYQTGHWQGSEQDASGNCQVKYIPDRHGVHKAKSGCSSPTGRDLAREETILDVSTDSFSRLHYKLQDDLVESCEAKEVYVSEVSSLREIGIIVQSSQHLHLEEQLDSPQQIIQAANVKDAIVLVQNGGPKLIPMPLSSELEPVPPKDIKFKNLLSMFKRSLKSDALAKESAAMAFLRILPVIESLPRTELISTLSDKSWKDIMPQMMDLLGASGSQEAYEAAKELAAGNLELLERYFWSVGQVTKPRESFVKDVLKYTQQTKESKQVLKETLILTLGTLARRIPGTEVADEVFQWIAKSMKTCKSEPCYLQFTRALKNLRSSKCIPILLDLLHSGNTKITIEAVKVLKVMPVSLMDQRVKTTLLTLYQDPRADSIIRTTSAEVLLQMKPGVNLFREILSGLDTNGSDERSLYITNRLLEYATSDPYLAQLILDHVNNQKINWNLLSNGGMSSTFSRTLASTLSGNATFSYGMEIAKKLLKRSNFEVTLRNDKEQAKLLQLDIFAGGLSSFMDSANSDDEGAATAGMELTILGNSLRPFVFFESMSDLISLYWSGKAEEKTSALKGSQLLHNNARLVHLGNGLVLDTKTQSCLSYDFSGQAKISMWDKTCQAVVENSAALVLSSEANIMAPWSQSKDSKMSIKHEVTSHAKLNLEAEIDVGSEDPQLCIRMQVPRFPVRYATTKWHTNGPTVIGGWKPVKRTQTYEVASPGKTLFLNWKNCELCTKMYPKRTK
ncbi:microsomal triacylglycerol transfer protein-like isoform X1 [Tigriopus californicus]|uniref:microsomal triacylglycerol transfer protein-like isoform X1 n=1 Tax=Tigriopus californicus TaxID=6832 RepID=UPI0027D9EE60|nr:microsomal triacylglycerol transfer protein-like isoform X1 [Tigriopus californicus]